MVVQNYIIIQRRARGHISWWSVPVVVEPLRWWRVDQSRGTRCCSVLVVLNLKVWWEYGSNPQKMDVQVPFQKIVSLVLYPCSSTAIGKMTPVNEDQKSLVQFLFLVARIWVDRIALVGRVWFWTQAMIWSQTAVFPRMVAVTVSPLIYPLSPCEGIRV